MESKRTLSGSLGVYAPGIWQAGSTCRFPFSWEERRVQLFFRKEDCRDPGRDSSLTLVCVAREKEGIKAPLQPGPFQLLAAPSLPSLWHRPPTLSPPPRSEVVGGAQSLSGDPASQSFGVLPPKVPALLCPRPPLLQPRLGRLPGRLLQALFYTKELGGGGE